MKAIFEGAVDIWYFWAVRQHGSSTCCCIKTVEKQLGWHKKAEKKHPTEIINNATLKKPDTGGSSRTNLAARTFWDRGSLYVKNTEKSTSGKRLATNGRHPDDVPRYSVNHMIPTAAVSQHSSRSYHIIRTPIFRCSKSFLQNNINSGGRQHAHDFESYGRRQGAVLQVGAEGPVVGWNNTRGIEMEMRWQGARVYHMTCSRSMSTCSLMRSTKEAANHKNTHPKRARVLKTAMKRRQFCEAVCLLFRRWPIYANDTYEVLSTGHTRPTFRPKDKGFHVSIIMDDRLNRWIAREPPPGDSRRILRGVGRRWLLCAVVQIEGRLHLMRIISYHHAK